jgi:hypothetical protein
MYFSVLILFCIVFFVLRQKSILYFFFSLSSSVFPVITHVECSFYFKLLRNRLGNKRAALPGGTLNVFSLALSCCSLAAVCDKELLFLALLEMSF